MGQEGTILTPQISFKVDLAVNNFYSLGKVRREKELSSAHGKYIDIRVPYSYILNILYTYT